MLNPGAALRKIMVDTAAVTALVSTRIYPISAPQSAPKPFGTYFRVDEQRERHMTNASGLSRARIQFDWFATNQDTLTNIMEQARLAVDTYCGIVTNSGESCNIKDVSIQNEEDAWENVADDSGTPVFRGTQDYFVWYNPTITER